MSEKQDWVVQFYDNPDATPEQLREEMNEFISWVKGQAFASEVEEVTRFEIVGGMVILCPERLIESLKAGPHVTNIVSNEPQEWTLD